MPPVVRPNGGGRGASNPGLDTFDPHPTKGRTTSIAEWSDRRDCACCTSDPVRRAALDRLHAQRQRVRTASALERLAPLVDHYCSRRAA